MSRIIEDNIITPTLEFQKSKFGERLGFLIESRGVSKNWLASKLGISKQALNYLINHSLKPKYIDQLASILEAQPKWLEFGIGTPFPVQSSTNKPFKIQVYDSDATLNILQSGKINFDGEILDYQAETTDNLIAYRLSNDSLFPPFIEGTILIFDKSLKPTNGKYVLFALDNDKSLMVRRYSKDGDDVYYTTNNNNYKNLVNIDVIIVGVLVEARYHVK